MPSPNSPTNSAPRYTLTPIGAADSELAYTLTREAMRDYVEQTWGPWIEADQRERHAQSFRPGAQDFIVANGRIQGLRALEWRETHIYLARLYLLTEAQGQGLGSAVLRDVLAQAGAVGRRVELQVLKVNVGAQRFYARHGLVRVGEREGYFEMCGV